MMLSFEVTRPGAITNAPPKSDSRLGVDIGGTFTDLVFMNDVTGELTVAKGLTSYPSPHQGVLDVIKSNIDDTSLRDTALFLHATTIALNAVLQRRGARVGLLTTEGMRDVLEIRRSQREAFNDPLWKPPLPLVPRYLRHGVKERLLSDGSVHTPLDAADLAEKLQLLVDGGVESIAVSFMHAYRNPAHEIEAREHLLALGFSGEIVLSHQVSGEYREYERTSTTVIDAFVRPTIKHYLNLLDSALRDVGYGGQMLATTSGGGAITFEEAVSRPVDTLDSGPAAGAVGTAEVCRELGIRYAVMADVGGTSFDTALIVDGAPSLKYEGEVAGFPLQTTWVDVRSIGAGGGSIAYVHADGLLRCGPQSAGSTPGPVCYGRGGTAPTSTDAAASLGMLGLGELDGGVTLDIEAARNALKTIAEQLGLDLDPLAKGVLQITSTNMANAIRQLTVERGFDPREAALFSFGGAGGVFAGLVARELGITRIVIPRHAGVFSAWALLGQDLARSSARTLLCSLNADGLESAMSVADGLLETLLQSCKFLSIPGVGAPQCRVKLDIRYVGQEYPLTIDARSVDAATSFTLAEIEAAFFEESGKSYGYVRHAPLEIVAVRVEVRAQLPRPLAPLPTNGDTEDQARDTEAFSFETGQRCEFRIVARDAMPVGQVFSGPMIITERTTTIYVDAGWGVTVTPTGHLIMDYKGTKA
ncbi:MAG: hydantoinase/oxoprolinase family protein [Sphingomonadaceae bacterium]